MKYLLIVGLMIGGCSLGLAQGSADKSISAEVSASVLEPLYVVSAMKSAKIITKGEFDKISPDDIDYVKMIDDPSSLYIYGDKAKNGVMLIVLKGNSVFEKYSSKKRRHR